MIYILDDDESIRGYVEYALNNSGLPTRGFGTPGEFFDALGKERPQLILLDIMLPEEDGLSVLQKLRKREDTAHLPVILLSAKSTEYDKVLGLDSGADDYVSKPFGIMELISRVKVLLRRTSPAADGDDGVSIGALFFSPSRRIVRVEGKNVALTFKEFELLCLLSAERGVVLSRDKILQQIWGYEFNGESRTVDVHIRTLRQKLGKCGDLIETVRGVGYRFSKE